MKPLDSVSARMFPSLAAYAKKVRRRELLALVCIAISAYVLGRDALSAYRERVATEHMLAVVMRVNNLESACQKDYPKRSLVTKAQAAVIVAQREKERGQP